VQQHRAPFDVPQEVQPQALALCGAGDQAGHVGDCVGRVPRADHAQVRHQRRERVVGDLRPGRRHRGDQRRLAGTGKTDQADVGDALELKDQVAGRAGLTEQREAGSLAAR